ncbi:unnamed protein product [Rodentolepis nana]|uniref:MPN domain-containing protein n=1 Tax=Rodentolepis nana TaxID=102285 RepID=A0A3P7UUF2_RODNA|nr:unnamed protein product [Rodentolepis nana]
MVGEDYLGNKYYENNRYFIGRNRWVIYGNRFGWDYEASQVPPEWHRWLHNMTDETPITNPPERKPWMLDHQENLTLEEPNKYLMEEIKLTPSAYQTIITHALTHEKEEIIGLLLAEECEGYIQIYAAKPCTRANKQLDRVEVNDIELARGIEDADKLKKILGRNIAVLGWYHSHPHITVHPSSHDITAQREFESLNRKFFGIIVSVFDGENEKQGEIRITSFRSNGEASTKLTIEPIQLDPSTRSKLFKLDVENWCSVPRVFLEETESEPVYDKIEIINQLCTKTVFPMATCCNALNEKLQAQ